MMGTSKVTQKGQVTIPADIRRRAGLAEGTDIVFIELDDGILIRTEASVRESLKLFDRRRRALRFTRGDLEDEVARERRSRRSVDAKNSA